MDRLRFFTASLLSLSFHAWLLAYAENLVLLHPEQPGGGAITIDLVPGGQSLQIAAPVAEPVAPPLPRPKPRVHISTIPKAPPAVLDGVRIATAEDIRHRIARDHDPAVAPPAPKVAPMPPHPSPPVAVAPVSDVPGNGNRPGIGEGQSGGTGSAEPYEAADDKPYTGRFRADTPGYNGRIFGQVSVRSSSGRDNRYGRIHMFRESAAYRDYSENSLFGYSFQERNGEVATRGFETGRVNTPGAYLMVTDLFADGHLSTMSHTVLLVFPRHAPSGRNLYDVVEEPNGDFQLRGPAGSFVVFEGHGAVRAANGFVIDPPGESGTPPRIRYRGLHLRLESVGSNPFLRDRPAAVVDAAGRQCTLSTSDLFSYAGRRESDVFRFKTDGEFFALLRERCAGLVLPEPAPTVMAQADHKSTEKQPAARGGEGLLPYLLRGFR